MWSRRRTFRSNGSRARLFVRNDSSKTIFEGGPGFFLFEIGIIFVFESIQKLIVCSSLCSETNGVAKIIIIHRPSRDSICMRLHIFF